MWDYQKSCKTVSIEKLTTPQDGYNVMLSRWWMVTPDDQVLFFKGYSPQCNSDKNVADILSKKFGLGIKLIEVAYVPDLDSKRDSELFFS